MKDTVERVRKLIATQKTPETSAAPEVVEEPMSSPPMGAEPQPMSSPPMGEEPVAPIEPSEELGEEQSNAIQGVPLYTLPSQDAEVEHH